MNTSNKKLSVRFLIIWTGQIISSIGSGLTAFSLGVYAFEKTHNATAYSLIILFSFLPSYSLKPIGGVFSDRLDRKLMMMIGDIGSALGLVFILLLFQNGIDQLWVIYTGVALSSVFVALQNPAYKASVTDLIEEDAYTKASGLMQMAESSRFLVSPVIAGFLLHFLNIEQILIVDICTFAIAVFAVFAVREQTASSTSSGPRNHFLADFTDGFKYTFSQKSLICLLSIISAVTFFVGFLQALIGPMILAFSNSKTLGIVQSVSVSGMVFSSFLIGIFSKIGNQVKILSVSLAVAGIFYALFGVSVNTIFIGISGFLFFSSLPFVNTALEVLIRKKVENKIQGRVWSIVSLISQLGMIVAFSTAGILADKLFNPLLMNNGLLASSVGKIIGTGEGRGIGFMFVVSGIFVILTAIYLWKNNTIKGMETVTSGEMGS